MYGSIPYMIPNIGMQTATPIANGLIGASNLGTAAKATGTGASILSKINWSSLLSNAQKTLNVVNQAIPLYYQVKPVFKNIKTLGRIGKEFTKLNSASVTDNTNNITSNTTLDEDSSNNAEIVENIPTPTFYL